jgi:hypothetical protein
LPIFIATARFDSRFNRLSLVDSNWGLIVSDYPDMISLVMGAYKGKIRWLAKVPF